MEFNWKCNKCGFSENLPSETQISFCPKCGTNVNAAADQIKSDTFEDFAKLKEKTKETLRNTFEFEKLEGFCFSNFIQQIFKRHSWEEIEDYMSFGIPSKRPQISEMNASWPAPWLFFRIILITIFFVWFFQWQEDFFGPQYVVFPRLVFGIIGIPFATLIFFWEINIPRNISIISTIKTMLISGLVAITITVFINKIISPRDVIWAGPVEETAKGLTMLFFLKNPRCRYKLNGLLIGATVGAGFAFIETAGYVFVGGNFTMEIRALLTPFMHIPWSAMVGFALWRTCINNKINLSNLLNRKFLALFITAILMHMFWNSSLLQDEMIIKTAIIAAIEYSIIAYMIQEGINEIRTLKSADTADV